MTEDTPSPAERHQARRERARRQFIGALAFLALAAAAAFALFDEDPPSASAVRISIPPPPSDDAPPTIATTPAATSATTDAPVEIIPPQQAPADADAAFAADAAAALASDAAVASNPASPAAGDPAAAGNPAAADGPFVFQVIGTGKRARAEEVAAEVAAEFSGYDAFVEPLDRGGQIIYRVRVGGFASRAEAEAAKEAFDKKFAARYPDSFVDELR